MSELNEGEKKVMALTIGYGFIIITLVTLLGLTIIGLSWLAKALGL